MKNVLQLVLFDLDDTLFDHQYSRRGGLLALQQAYPPLVCLPIEALAAEHERQLTASYDQVLDGALSLAANRLERFRHMFVNCGVAMPMAEVEQAMQRYRRAYEAQRRAAPGVGGAAGPPTPAPAHRGGNQWPGSSPAGKTHSVSTRRSSSTLSLPQKRRR